MTNEQRIDLIETYAKLLSDEIATWRKEQVGAATPAPAPRKGPSEIEVAKAFAKRMATIKRRRTGLKIQGNLQNN